MKSTPETLFLLSLKSWVNSSIYLNQKESKGIKTNRLDYEFQKSQ